MTDMLYRPLGRSGLMVSAVGIGCNNFGRADTLTETQEGTTSVVDAALESGVNFFDTADVYGKRPGLSEELLGRALAGRRDDVVVATKFGHATLDGGIAQPWARGSRRYVRRAVEASLRRLDTEWIDLYQLHTPDPTTPIDETLSVLDDLITEGKVRYIGHSNLSGWQIAEADYEAVLGSHPRFISAQNEFSLIVRDAEREVLPAVQRFGLGFLPFFPLYNGLFTGKFTRAGGPADSRIMRIRKHLLDNAPWDAIEALQSFAEARGRTLLEVTFGWLLAQPNLSSVIAGATTAAQIRENAAAGVAWTPTPTEVAEIDRLFPGPANS
ncbi:aldo/keto reductase [Leifsonia sp. ALI-44-B]|uniref:aldo/keto reductase n=1 Tax=Leifsonia sp. ALI-44-B TaxID=1933776 RepID=UPI00097C53A7|nr:aldo/keto reductase [Leifsonia sp. ALI-44-B]ONI62007.1 aldo/keto reductase [Leifsonia sp. ALI-44-B]